MYALPVSCEEACVDNRGDNYQKNNLRIVAKYLNDFQLRSFEQLRQDEEVKVATAKGTGGRPKQLTKEEKEAIKQRVGANELDALRGLNNLLIDFLTRIKAIHHWDAKFSHLFAKFSCVAANFQSHIYQAIASIQGALHNFELDAFEAIGFDVDKLFDS